MCHFRCIGVQQVSEIPCLRCSSPIFTVQSLVRRSNALVRQEACPIRRHRAGNGGCIASPERARAFRSEHRGGESTTCNQRPTAQLQPGLDDILRVAKCPASDASESARKDGIQSRGVRVLVLAQRLLQQLVPGVGGWTQSQCHWSTHTHTHTHTHVHARTRRHTQTHRERARESKSESESESARARERGTWAPDLRAEHAYIRSYLSRCTRDIAAPEASEPILCHHPPKLAACATRTSQVSMMN